LIVSANDDRVKRKCRLTRECPMSESHVVSRQEILQLECSRRWRRDGLKTKRGAFEERSNDFERSAGRRCKVERNEGGWSDAMEAWRFAGKLCIPGG